MLKPVPTKAFLQPVKAAAMCTAPQPSQYQLRLFYSRSCHVHGPLAKPVPIKAFLQPARKAAAMCTAAPQPRQLPCAQHPTLKLAHLPLSHRFC